MLTPYLQGRLHTKDIDTVTSQTNDMFIPNHGILNPDALILYQQKIIPKDLLDNLLDERYKYKFEEVHPSWVPNEIVEFYKDTNFIPIRIVYATNTIQLGTLFEYQKETPPIYGTLKRDIIPIRIYEYVDLYTRIYGKEPPFILPLSELDLFDMIVREAVALKAADITISQRSNRVEVYYNVNKRKVYSKRTLPKSIMSNLVTLLTSRAGRSASVGEREPLYFTLDLDDMHRGRTVVNYKYGGYVISIRVLSNELHSNTFKSLNIPQEVQDFLYKYYVGGNTGLKLICGPTYSGKNTTIITILDEIHINNDQKIVSVENPVEILTDYIEQIDADTEQEFYDSVNSLLRQNPDLVYIAEMTDKTAVETMKVANTGKSVLSSIHCNSVAEVVSRLVDLTELPISTIIQILDSVIYQELLPKKCPHCGDKGCDNCYRAGVIPIFSYVHLTPSIKRELVDKELSEIYKTLEQHTKGLDLIDKLRDDGVISQVTWERRRHLYD